MLFYRLVIEIMSIMICKQKYFRISHFIIIYKMITAGHYRENASQLQPSQLERYKKSRKKNNIVEKYIKSI